MTAPYSASKSGEALAIVITLTTLASLAVTLRFVARRIVGQELKADDYLVAGGAVCWIYFVTICPSILSAGFVLLTDIIPTDCFVDLRLSCDRWLVEFTFVVLPLVFRAMKVICC